MAYRSPQGPVPAAGPEPGRAGDLAKTLALGLYVPLLFMFGFLLCYLLPFHAPAPHGVKVAVAGPVSAAGIGAGLRQQPAGAFEVIPVPGAAQARQQVLDQAAQAAFVVSGPDAILYTAGAGGSRVSQTVTAAFTPVAAAQDLTLTTVDLVPPVPGDPSGTSLYYVALGWAVIPVLVSMQLQAARLSTRARLAVIAAAGAFAAIAVFLISYGLGAVPGQSLAMLYGFLAFEAVALTVSGLAAFTGRWTAAVAPPLFVFLSIPSSGGSVPYQMVPAFYSWLHPILPLGNLIDALRSIFYFDGTNMTRPTLVLLAWIAAGAALITASALPDRTRQPHPPAPAMPAAAPAGTAGHASRPIPGPRPPALFGTVTDTAGAPVPGAHITIINAGGHQILRTSTGPDGRYTAHGLPDGILTVLLSPPGRTPVATRVTLNRDLPARQDIVIPDPAHGTRRPCITSYPSQCRGRSGAPQGL